MTAQLAPHLRNPDSEAYHLVSIATQRGHVVLDMAPTRGRRSYLCTHCGAGMTWQAGGGRYVGALAEGRTACFPTLDQSGAPPEDDD